MIEIIDIALAILSIIAVISFIVFIVLGVAYNVSRLQEVANFGTNYFLLKIKILAKRKREFTTKFAIAPNVCYPNFVYASSVLHLKYCFY